MSWFLRSHPDTAMASARAPSHWAIRRTKRMLVMIVTSYWGSAKFPKLMPMLADAETSLPAWSCPKNDTSATVEMIVGLAASAASGASCFAVWRTMSNPAVTSPSSGTVKVSPESIGCGTSTPGVLRPSVRRYTTRYRVNVTWLSALGAAGTPGTPGSFSTSDIVTAPTSLKVVAHGVVVEQGSGVVTNVMTSERSVPPMASGSAPDAASSL